MYNRMQESEYLLQIIEGNKEYKHKVVFMLANNKIYICLDRYIRISKETMIQMIIVLQYSKIIVITFGNISSINNRTMLVPITIGNYIRNCNQNEFVLYINTCSFDEFFSISVNKEIERTSNFKIIHKMVQNVIKGKTKCTNALSTDDTMVFITV